MCSVFDVLIAGAGPAGSIAAVVLARAGVRVLVLDRATFPRPKLCGDTVNPGPGRGACPDILATKGRPALSRMPGLSLARQRARSPTAGDRPVQRLLKLSWSPTSAIAALVSVGVISAAIWMPKAPLSTCTFRLSPCCTAYQLATAALLFRCADTNW